MVFSRYSAVLLLTRRLSNVNINNLERFKTVETTKTIKRYKKDPITNESRNYSTLVTSKYGIDDSKSIKPVSNIGKNESESPTEILSLNSRTYDSKCDSELDFEDLEFTLDVPFEKRPGALDPCVDDLSHIGPSFTGTFNFAAYADKSPMIQKLAELGVDFYKIERRNNLAKFLLPLDFDRDMKYHIRFLNDCGVPPDKLGEYLTKNPLIFKEDLDDLHTRIRYLRAHKFSPNMIARIVTNNPFWVMFSTKRIDGRLGLFQREFKLSGKDVRHLATKQPRIVTYNIKHLQENTFVVKEVMGFDQDETRLILLAKPRIWMKSRAFIEETFDYVHNEMKIPHKIIVHQPGILTCRLYRLKQRHMYLVSLKRAQYDSQKPMYVSPNMLISDTDAEFCMNVAKTPVENYNAFLKTL